MELHIVLLFFFLVSYLEEHLVRLSYQSRLISDIDDQ